MIPEYKFTDEDILKRYVDYYGDERIFADGLVPSLRLKLSNLSELICIHGVSSFFEETVSYDFDRSGHTNLVFGYRPVKILNSVPSVSGAKRVVR